ncbi:MAG: hypothetical protein GY915_07535 [bacterium]|nr:hypothetical protein [bacterium]
MQKNSLAFSATQDPNVMGILKAHSKGLSCPLLCERKDWTVQKAPHQEGFSWSPENGDLLPLPPLKMLGDHQRQNAALALATLEGIQEEFPLSRNSLTKGLFKVQLPGRLQKIDLFSQGPEVWFDGAHNSHATEQLAPFVNNRWGKCSITLILGRSRPCPIEAQNLIKPLLPFIKRLVLTGGPDLQDPKSFSQSMDHLGSLTDSQTFETVQSALKFSAQFPEPTLVTGSLYLTGHLRQLP